MPITHLADLPIADKRLLLRLDLNVPLKQAAIASDARIRAALPSIRLAVRGGARVMLMSHLGRPREGTVDPNLSLAAVARYLCTALGQRVELVRDYLRKPPRVGAGEVVLLENVRFNVGEMADAAALAKRYAALCDVYVMDAFGVAHRAQASTHGVGLYAAERCAGPLLHAELGALTQALRRPPRPLTAIVGGAKLSTKLGLLEALSTKVEQLVPGGGIGNTFLAAAGYAVGHSLYQADWVPRARALLHQAAQSGRQILLPSDVVVAKACREDAAATVKNIDAVAADDWILDIGPQTARRYAELMRRAGSIVWNGPLGVFEWPQFAAGTRAVGQAIGAAAAFSIAGGGDTLAALEQFDLYEKMSYVSTGGGAFLAFLQGETLPAVAMLEGS